MDLPNFGEARLKASTKRLITGYKVLRGSVPSVRDSLQQAFVVFDKADTF
jgi:hypothetical protein